MKVNYQERIDLTADELKIILSEQRTLPNKQKIQALYWLKTGASQSLTDVAERLGVHRITVHRWLTQYTAGGMPELLEIRQATGRPRVIPSAVIAGLSEKLSEESCDFKTYKEIGQWVEENYQVSVKYQTLHKQVHYRMKANLKEPKPVSNEKAQEAAIEFKKTSKNLVNND